MVISSAADRRGQLVVTYPLKVEEARPKTEPLNRPRIRWNVLFWYAMFVGTIIVLTITNASLKKTCDDYLLLSKADRLQIAELSEQLQTAQDTAAHWKNVFNQPTRIKGPPAIAVDRPEEQGIRNSEPSDEEIISQIIQVSGSSEESGLGH